MPGASCTPVCAFAHRKKSECRVSSQSYMHVSVIRWRSLMEPTSVLKIPRWRQRSVMRADSSLEPTHETLRVPSHDILGDNSSGSQPGSPAIPEKCDVVRTG